MVVSAADEGDERGSTGGEPGPDRLQRLSLAEPARLRHIGQREPVRGSVLKKGLLLIRAVEVQQPDRQYHAHQILPF